MIAVDLGTRYSDMQCAVCHRPLQRCDRVLTSYRHGKPHVIHAHPCVAAVLRRGPRGCSRPHHEAAAGPRGAADAAARGEARSHAAQARTAEGKARAGHPQAGKRSDAVNEQRIEHDVNRIGDP